MKYWNSNVAEKTLEKRRKRKALKKIREILLTLFFWPRGPTYRDNNLIWRENSKQNQKFVKMQQFCTFWQFQFDGKNQNKIWYVYIS